MAIGIDGKTTIVTGGASGMGKVAAMTFARAGAKVVVTTDANIKGAEDTVRTIKEAGGEASFVKCDVSKEKDVEALVAKTLELYGSLDFAFNNAGIGPDGKRIPVVNLADCPADIWEKTIGVNLTGVFLCMKHEIKQMQKQGKGAIVNTSSIGAFKPLPGFSAYSASKSGIIALTKIAATEYAAAGIRINCICPGPTERTQLIDNLTAFDTNEKKRAENAIPMHRMGTPEEVAETVLWLCSDAASYVTANVVVLDGGLSNT
jgi:NAD(P)-dependent dehydrogenase (short-subunit alcohol dehydrogenase family)